MDKDLLTLLLQTETEEKKALENSGDIHQLTYGKKEIVHLEGEPCDYFEIVLSGTVVVQRIDEEGHLLTISSFSRGHILGANLVFSSTPFFPMTVTATEETQLYRLTKTAIKTLCMKDEDTLEAVLNNLSNRSLYLGDTIKRLTKTTIREQLSTYLKKQQKSQGTNPIILPVSKTALADQFGIARTSLSRELQSMKAEGLIAFEGDRVWVELM